MDPAHASLSIVLGIAATLLATRLPPRKPGRRDPITIVVPFPPGPALDLVAADWREDSRAARQTVVIENSHRRQRRDRLQRRGAIAPDGYTLLAATPGACHGRPPDEEPAL